MCDELGEGLVQAPRDEVDALALDVDIARRRDECLDLADSMTVAHRPAQPELRARRYACPKPIVNGPEGRNTRDVAASRRRRAIPWLCSSLRPGVRNG